MLVQDARLLLLFSELDLRRRKVCTVGRFDWLEQRAAHTIEHGDPLPVFRQIGDE
ncbi:hypothetical protein D3C81_2278220 [compost metagenome]